MMDGAPLAFFDVRAKRERGQGVRVPGPLGTNRFRPRQGQRGEARKAVATTWQVIFARTGTLTPPPPSPFCTGIKKARGCA
jgi:hypothetical protein